MEETSLDDFLGDGPEEESAVAGEPGAGDGGDESGTTEVEPATTTFAWSPGGVCKACGERVRERWRGERGLVCAECKEW